MKTSLKRILLLAVLAGSFFGLGFTADHIIASLETRGARHRNLMTLFRDAGDDRAYFYFMGAADEDAALIRLESIE